MAIVKFDHLKKKHRRLRRDYDEHFSVRMHRALSWLGRAEKEHNDVLRSNRSKEQSHLFYVRKKIL